MLSVFWSLLIGRRMRFDLSCLQVRLEANHTLLHPFIFPTLQGFLPSGVMKTRSLIPTDSTARCCQSELTLGALEPGGRVALLWFTSSSSHNLFLHVSQETNFSGGFFPWVFLLVSSRRFCFSAAIMIAVVY